MGAVSSYGSPNRMRRTPLSRGTKQMKRSGFKRKLKVVKVKKPKKKTTSQLKKKLDEIFSRYIRLKHSKDDGKSSCYTCGVEKHWRELQNGHFISRSYLATRFNEDNCRPQCVGCNVFGGGRQVVFGSKLEAEKNGIINMLYRKAQEITKDYPYQERINHYTELLKEYEKGNNQTL